MIQWFPLEAGVIDDALLDAHKKFESLDDVNKKDFTHKDRYEHAAAYLSAAIPEESRRLDMIEQWTLQKNQLNYPQYNSIGLFHYSVKNNRTRAEKVIQMINSENLEKITVGNLWLAGGKEFMQETKLNYKANELSDIEDHYNDAESKWEYLSKSKLYAELIAGEDHLQSRIMLIWFVIAPSVAFESIMDEISQNTPDWYSQVQKLRNELENFHLNANHGKQKAIKEDILVVINQNEATMSGLELLYANVVLRKLFFDQYRPVFGRLSNNEYFSAMIDVIQSDQKIVKLAKLNPTVAKLDFFVSVDETHHAKLMKNLPKDNLESSGSNEISAKDGKRSFGFRSLRLTMSQIFVVLALFGIVIILFILRKRL